MQIQGAHHQPVPLFRKRQEQDLGAKRVKAWKAVVPDAGTADSIVESILDLVEGTGVEHDRR